MTRLLFHYRQVVKDNEEFGYFAGLSVNAYARYRGASDPGGRTPDSSLSLNVNPFLGYDKGRPYKSSNRDPMTFALLLIIENSEFRYRDDISII